MAHGFIYLTDHSSPTGSRLFNGSSVKCWCQRVTISGQNNLDVPFKPNQDPELTSADQLESGTRGDIGSSWNRRKNHIQDTGAENMQITIAGGWEVNSVGSVTGTVHPKEYNLSPWKIKRMAESGHSFFLKGGTAVQWLLGGEIDDSSTGSYYIPGSGIPVHIAQWNMEDKADEQEYVSWQINLVEDKDTINMTN